MGLSNLVRESLRFAVLLAYPEVGFFLPSLEFLGAAERAQHGIQKRWSVGFLVQQELGIVLNSKDRVNTELPDFDFPVSQLLDVFRNRARQLGKFLAVDHIMARAVPRPRSGHDVVV